MLADQYNPTELSKMGEFKLIEHLTENIEIKHKSTLKGVGDDAAVIKGVEKCTVITTDMLVENVHFNMIYSPLKHLGYKVVSVNVSDIYAMNATPTQITISIAVSNKMSLEALEDLYSGIYLACKHFNVDLIGGDTTSSVSGLIISVTAIGEAKEEDIVYRNTANETDLILVSGDLGSAYMGLQLLERENEVFKENPSFQPDFQGKEYILERQLKPEARKDVIKELRKLKVKPTSMIDVSDGLSSELNHICKQSGTGCVIYEDKIPIDAQTIMQAEEFNINPLVCALNGGEDYELLFTISLQDYDKIKDCKHFSVIGHISDKTSGLILSNKAGQAIALQSQGWDSFRK